MSERILARHDLHRRAYWPSTRASSSSRSVPHTTRARHSRARSSSGNESTTPAAFAKAVGLVVSGAKFDAETEDCFTLFAEIKGEEL